MNLFKMKKFRFVLLILLSFVLIACSNGESNDSEVDAPSSSPDEGGEATSSVDEEITLKFGHPGKEGIPYYIAAEGFVEELEEKTDGRVNITIYPASQLGSEAEMAEEVYQGSLDMAWVSAGPLSSYHEDFNVLHLPFLFDDLQHAYDSMNGKFGNLLNEKLEDVGLKNLGYMSHGFENIANTEVPVLKAEDLKGLKLRVQDSPAKISALRALGADPTPVPDTELYTALQQGVVQGNVSVVASYGNSNIYEVTNYLSEVPLTFLPGPLLINKELFDSFDADLQEIFTELGLKYAKIGTEENEKFVEEIFDRALESDVEISRIDEIDVESFREAVESVHEEYSHLEEYLSAIE